MKIPCPCAESNDAFWGFKIRCLVTTQTYLIRDSLESWVYSDLLDSRGFPFLVRNRSVGSQTIVNSQNLLSINLHTIVIFGQASVFYKFHRTKWIWADSIRVSVGIATTFVPWRFYYQSLNRIKFPVFIRFHIVHEYCQWYGM